MMENIVLGDTKKKRNKKTKVQEDICDVCSRYMLCSVISTVQQYSNIILCKECLYTALTAIWDVKKE